MRPRDQLRIASVLASVRTVLTSTARPGRRTGAVLLVHEDQTLAGIFTDSDLARLLETRRDGELDRPITEVMTSRPLTVPEHAVLADVVTLLAERKISELPVVDQEGRPIGLIDITDVIGWLPQDSGD
jgi:arabinose-5-phosphate isomerase